MTTTESPFEARFVEKLGGLKHQHRPEIRDCAAVEANFREKFEALNRVRLTDAEFTRLVGEIVTPDVVTASHTLAARPRSPATTVPRSTSCCTTSRNGATNNDEVVSQLRINTDYSHHRYDLLLLISGILVVQVELKTLGINPRRAMEQIVEYMNDLGNGYTSMLLRFMQLFIEP